MSPPLFVAGDTCGLFVRDDKYRTVRVVRSRHKPGVGNVYECLEGPGVGTILVNEAYLTPPVAAANAQAAARSLAAAPYFLRPRRIRYAVACLQASRGRGDAFDAFVGEMSQHGGPSGLDLAIDVLRRLPPGTLLRSFRAMSSRSRPGTPQDSGQYDAWHVLLRAFACAQLPLVSRLRRLYRRLVAGDPAEREAAAYALGDLGGPDAGRILRHASEGDDPSSRVRMAIADGIESLEDCP